MEEDSKIEGASRKMPIQQKYLTSAELFNIFELEMKDSTTFRFIGEAKNPCNIIFKEKEFYVYIKNLSSAYFSNIDVSRAQLTGVDSLLEIKKTDALFVLLGYDVENRVFAAWNPHVAKQRIGTAASPSFYSRYSWQKEANDIGKFIKRELKNYGTVLLFPQKYVSHFFEKIDKFFPDTSEYVAMPSKRIRKANAAYRELTNTENLSEFGQYLSSHDYGKNIQEFISVIKSLIKGSLISDNRKIFLAYNSLSEYHDAANDFLNLDEVKRLDEQTNNVLSKAFKKYIDFLIEACVLEKPLDSERIIESQDTSCAAIECKDREVNPLVEVNEVGKDEVGKDEVGKDEVGKDKVDYEALYTNENGLLTRIANPKLIDLLREDLNVITRSKLDFD